MKKIKKRWIIIGVIILLVLGSWGYAKLGKTKEGSETFKVVKQDLTEIVSEVGKVVPVKDMEMTFPVTGKIVQILVDEGDSIEQGQILARLDATKAQADLAKANAVVSESQARLDKVKTGVSVEDVKVSETAVKNAENALAKAKVSAENDIALAESSVAVSQTSFNNAKKDLEDQEKENAEDLKQAYEDAYDILKDSNAKADTALNKIDYIKDRYFSQWEQEVDNKIQSKENALKATFADIKEIIESTVPEEHETIDSTLKEVKDALNEIADLLAYMRSEIEDKVSISSTVTDKGYIDTERANISTAISSTTGAIQAISLAILDNEINLNSEQSSYDAAEVALASAQANLASAKSLADSKISSAEGALELAQDQLALKISPARQEDIALYQAQLEQAIAYVTVLQQSLSDSTLVAPVAGFVTQIYSEIGEIASLASPVLSMIGRDQYQVEAYISELDIANVEEGDLVEISFDAFDSARIFKGSILKINPFETLVDDDVYYKVVIKFDEYDKVIRSGMTADIQVITASKENVLVVPSRYIGQEGDKRFVKIPSKEEGAEAERVEVEVGLKGLEMSEITDGLTEGQEIIPYY